MRLYEFKDRQLEEFVRTVLSTVNDVGSGHLPQKIIFGNAELEDNAEQYIEVAIDRYIKEKLEKGDQKKGG